MEYLKGKKTYIICGLMILIAIIKLIAGDITFMQFFQDEYVLMALGFAGLRNGMNSAK